MKTRSNNKYTPLRPKPEVSTNIDPDYWENRLKSAGLPTTDDMLSRHPTEKQMTIRRLQARRNHIVSQLLVDNPTMLRSKALGLANRQVFG